MSTAWCMISLGRPHGDDSVQIVVFGLEVVKKPLFIGASHVIIILQEDFCNDFATIYLKIVFATVAIVPIG